MEQKTAYKNCQSCGIPFQKDPQKGGTEKDGTKSTKYCSYCYEKGEFKGGNLTLKEFSELSRKGMVEGGHSKFFAWLFSRSFMLAHLDRWKSKK
ncbi:MAG: zinc ribbon domain-containing protein [Bacteroidia bacterium]